MAWYDFLLVIFLGWIGELWDKIKKWFGEQKDRVIKWVTGGWITLTGWFGEQKTKLIKWVTGGYIALTTWFGDQKTKLIKWVTGGYIALTTWFGDQKTKLIKWVTGGYNSITKWMDEQKTKVNKFVFEQWGNLTKWWDEQDIQLKVKRDREFEDHKVVTAGYSFLPDNVLEFDWGKNFDFFTIMIVPFIDDVVVWIAENAFRMPEELTGFIDGISGALFFEEDPRPSEEEIERRKRKLIELFLKRREMIRKRIWRKPGG